MVEFQITKTGIADPGYNENVKTLERVNVLTFFYGVGEGAGVGISGVPGPYSYLACQAM